MRNKHAESKPRRKAEDERIEFLSSVDSLLVMRTELDLGCQEKLDDTCFSFFLVSPRFPSVAAVDIAVPSHMVLPSSHLVPALGLLG